VGKRLLFMVNDPGFFLSHRLPVALAAQHAGYEVHVATADGPAISDIPVKELEHHVLPLSRSGKNLFLEFGTLVAIYRLFRRINPDVVHLVTIKPVLYGGIVARIVGVPGVVVAISGLGAVFIAQTPMAGILRRLVRSLYKLALGHKNLKVIFQNPDDRAILQGLGAVRPEQTVMIRGSGVDLADYPVAPEPDGIPVVAFAARLLKDKGVGEFVEAASQLQVRGIQARFLLIGSPDPGNPASVTNKELDAWEREGIVELLGYRKDIPDLFARSHIVVLPSYREGLPRVLIEAAACGRAVITTDVPGCRDAIEPDKTGLLVPVRDSVALADAIERLIKDSDLRRRMGKAGRELAEREFAIEKVVAAHLEVYRTLSSASDRGRD